MKIILAILAVTPLITYVDTIWLTARQIMTDYSL